MGGGKTYLGFPRKQKIGVKNILVRESEIGEECRRFRAWISLIFLSVLFSNSLFFSIARHSLFFWVFFPSRILGPRLGRKILVFFGGFPCFLPEKQGKEDQGLGMNYWEGMKTWKKTRPKNPRNIFAIKIRWEIRRQFSSNSPDQLKFTPNQQVLNPTPLNPTPATCHKRKRKLRCSFRSAALQKLHCNIGLSAVRKSFGPKAAQQQTKNCTATSKKLRCRKVALSCRFPAAFKPPRLGTPVSDLLTKTALQNLGLNISCVFLGGNVFSNAPLQNQASESGLGLVGAHVLYVDTWEGENVVRRRLLN